MTQTRILAMAIGIFDPKSSPRGRSLFPKWDGFVRKLKRHAYTRVAYFLRCFELFAAAATTCCTPEHCWPRYYRAALTSRSRRVDLVRSFGGFFAISRQPSTRYPTVSRIQWDWPPRQL